MQNNRRICISGLLASGKSTIAKEISSSLDLRYVSVGNIYRRNSSLSGIENPEEIKKWDNYLDSLIVEEIQEGNLVIEGRTVGYLGNTQKKDFPGLINILLSSDPEVRKERARKRGGERGLRRDSLDVHRFYEKYGVDIFSDCYYDCIIDNSFISAEESVDVIKKYIERRLE